MNHAALLTHGLGSRGGFLWDTIRDKCPTHNDVLTEMGNRQRMLAAYSKGKPMDQVQEELLLDIRFLETIAWRMYMYGVRRTVLTALRPTGKGEFFKRRRTDPTYWRMKALAGEKKADKWLKVMMRNEWERGVLRRFRY